MRIAAPDIAQVALEVLDVDLIEADYGRVQADVGFCDAVAEVVRSAIFGNLLFSTVERLEEYLYVLLVSFLSTVHRSA